MSAEDSKRTSEQGARTQKKNHIRIYIKKTRKANICALMSYRGGKGRVGGTIEMGAGPIWGMK